MTVLEKVRRAALNDESITLTATEVNAVYAALAWGKEVLESLNSADDDTMGGNSRTSGLDEEAEA